MKENLVKELEETEKKISQLQARVAELNHEIHSENISSDGEFFKSLENKTIRYRKNDGDRVYLVTKYDGYKTFGHCLVCKSVYTSECDGITRMFYQVDNISYFNKEDFEKAYNVFPASTFVNAVKKAYKKISDELAEQIGNIY